MKKICEAIGGKGKQKPPEGARKVPTKPAKK
jgi:hypothetical protein